MKRNEIFGLFLIAFSSVCFVYGKQPQTPFFVYQDDARMLIDTYLVDAFGQITVPSAQLELACNFVYYAYVRSTTTLIAQEKLLRTINMMWYGWQNFVQTRINAHKELPFSIDDEELDYCAQQFVPHLASVRKKNRQYIQILDLIDRNRANLDTVHFVTAARDKAHEHITDAFLNVKQYITSLVEHLRDNSTDMHKGKILDSLLSYLPDMAITPFTRADEMTSIASKEGWRVLKYIQEIGNHTWYTIGTARSEFYRLLYDELYQTCLKSNIRMESLHLLLEETESFLPSPTQLQLDILTF